MRIFPQVIYGLAFELIMGSASAQGGPFDPTFDYGIPVSARAKLAGLVQDSKGNLVSAATYGSSPDNRLTLVHIPENGNTASYFGLIDLPSTGSALAKDHHNRLLVGGTTTLKFGCSEGDKNVDVLLLMRLQDIYNLDPTFGSSGISPMWDCNRPNVTVTGVAVDTNDSIVSMADLAADVSFQNISVFKWSASGVQDITFGESGEAKINFAHRQTEGLGISIDGEQRVLISGVGTIEDVDGLWETPLVFRLSPKGQLDSTFGTDGLVELYPLGRGSAAGVTVDGYGRVLITGVLYKPGFGQHGFVVRLKEDGSVDKTFGTDGWVNLPDGSAGLSITVDSHSRPVVSGYQPDPHLSINDATIYHLNLDGSMNTAVGFQGIYTFSLGTEDAAAKALLVDRSGRTISIINGTTMICYDELFGDGFD